jgi:membrane associated rhomboid family serine protease
MTPRVCLDHGVFEGAPTCATCGKPALDLDNDSERELALAAIAAHPPSPRRMELVLGIPLVLAIVGVLIYVKNERVGTYTAYAFTLVAIAVFAWAGRPPAQWRIPVTHADRVRFWTSAPIVASFLCLAFVVVADVVGHPALWYAHGMPPWRIATASLTHSGFLHIVGNLSFTLMLGLTVDRRVGRAATWIIFAASAVAAALAQAQFSDKPMVGFSGAVYGIFGATLALMPTSPQLMRMRDESAVAMPTWAWMLVIIPAYTLIAAFDPNTHTAWVAHLGGFAAGLFVALPMRRIKPSARFQLMEKLRRDQIESATRAQRFDVMSTETAAPDGYENVATSQDAEIAAFHAAARRKKMRVSIIGGGILIAVGGTAATLATLMQATRMASGRRAQVIVIGLVTVMSGVFMLRQAFVERRRHREPR